MLPSQPIYLEKMSDFSWKKIIFDFFILIDKASQTFNQIWSQIVPGSDYL